MADRRLTQEIAEVLYQLPHGERLTQEMVEVLYQLPRGLRVTQVVVEIVADVYISDVWGPAVAQI